MKYIILIALAFTSSAALFAQSSTSTTPAAPAVTNSEIAAETALNKKLIDNAALSEKYIQESSANKPQSSIKILGKTIGTTSTVDKNNLTDQEKQLVDNYVDQAKANRILNEKCVGEMKQGCRGDEVDHKTMGMSPAMMRIATQAYATVGAMGDILPISKGTGEWFNKKAPEAKPETGTGTGTPADTQAASGAAKPGTPAAATKETPKDASKEKANDYCRYIPAATETVAKFTQSANVKEIDSKVNNGGETSQKESLLKAAKSHDSRATQAQVQAVGWYGGAACYAYQATSGAFAVDTALIVKLGATTLLGTFYQMEVGANKEYAQKTRDIANSLPGKGECNPVTENECYCSEPEHANDPQYCQAQIAARASGTAFMKVACTDSNLKIDPNCNCVKSNSCFDKFMENQGAVDLQMGVGYSNSPFKPIASLAQGKLEGGTLNSAAFARTSAIAKKALNDLASKFPPTGNLTAEQKASVDAMVARGIPNNVARLMAQNPPSKAAMDSASAKLSGIGSDYAYAGYVPAGSSRVLDFTGGHGLGVGGKKADKKSGVDDFLGKIGGGKSAANSKILEFAQRAQERAPQITREDKPLFEIISIRYQISGRRLLQVDSNN
ncbi:MAG: hypothetical protein WC635_05655 [Bacteriovorax sp.]|jgi:hypothetical protein